MPTLLLLLLLARGPAPLPALAPADALLFAGQPEEKRVSMLVVMRDQADLAAATGIPDRLERRRFVYESLRAQAESAQASLRRDLRARGIAFRPHFLRDMVEVEADRATAAWLAARADVARLAANRPSALHRIEPAPERRAAPAAASAVQPNLALIGATVLWDRGITGEGVVIGVADTGFEWEHPALKNRYRGWDGVAASHDYNWHDAVHENVTLNACGADSPAPCDDQGHGTSTAGIAVGASGEGIIGVAPGARLVGCRNMDVGIGSPARYVECFEWFMAPTDSHGENPRPDLAPDVINNSWSCPASEGCTDPDVLNDAVDAMRAAGFGMAFAAGNSGPQCASLAAAPAVGPGSFAVGATALDDTIAVFSALGPVTSDGSNRLKPDLTAPGVDVRTSKVGGAYTPSFSGTSAAAPHVAGAIALLWSAIPALRGDVSGTEELLERSAVPRTSATNCGPFRGSDIPNPVFGWGRLDVLRAYDLAVGRTVPLAVPPESRETRVLPPRD